MVMNWKWVKPASVFGLTRHRWLVFKFEASWQRSYLAPRPPSFGPVHLSTSTWNAPQSVRFLKSRRKRLNQEYLFPLGERLTSSSRNKALSLGQLSLKNYNINIERFKKKIVADLFHYFYCAPVPPVTYSLELLFRTVSSPSTQLLFHVSFKD